ncbi:MAG: U32 family peptidase [bacterium]|nr:U32 family peptidase [bacterium]
MFKREKPELLIPASNLEVLQVAVQYGADAIYIGGEMYGLRAKAKNFSKEDMIEGIKYAHKYGKKVYVTCNISAHNGDLAGARKYFEELGEIGPDALIISDAGMFELAGEACPNIERHISTQANNTNFNTFNFWHQLGATRVVTARELSIEEIADIRKNIPDDLEIETFIHGAMCMAYSGRCSLSSFMTGRDANKGSCTHACRWKYNVVEETQTGEYETLEESEDGTYIFNSKDLCMIDHIPDIINAGIDSLKIEGRMKTALYVASVARTYRQAIDDYYKDPALYEQNIPHYWDEIAKCTYRKYTTGFFYNKPDQETQIYDNNTYIKGYSYLGKISGKNAEGLFELEQRNKFSVGEELEIMKPSGENIMATVKRITDEDGADMESCPHPKQKIFVDFGVELDEFDIIRRREA